MSEDPTSDDGGEGGANRPTPGSGTSEGPRDPKGAAAEAGSAQSGDPTSGEGTGAPVKRRRGRRILKWTAISMAAVLIAGAGASYAYYRKLNGNISREDVNDLLPSNRPVKQSEAMNILLIGSDSRDGENSDYGAGIGQRGDTTILLHLSPGGDKAIGLSFPRDMMVNIPECKRKGASPSPAQFGMLNAAFAYAGPSCTWNMIESLTQIHIDHYVIIDFAGFKRVVDALGGVEICVPKAVNDRKARLNLKAGRQVVQGDQALGYVRTRTGGLGNGSDLDRIDRQKKFMSAVVQKATSSDMLSDPTKILKFLNAATKSISTDKGFSVGDMRKLANGMKGMDADGVRFVTVPFGAYAPDPNRVALDKVRAEPLFEAIRKDTTVPDIAPTPSAKPSNQPVVQIKSVKPVQPTLVKVQVYDGSGRPDLARQVAGQLKSEKYKISGTPGSRPGGTVAKTRILYGRGAERQAATLKTLLPGLRPAADKSVPAGVVQLVIGEDWKGLKGLPPTGAREIRADDNICNGA